ncbi:Apc13p-domain-containing protein [Pseudovirgaria hyperparasitica]|uniref:Apc13p-domain-containing protein n=1 Tax=Pseudovirgaria hyperparasitica TaxID=470096 RepID=A0A6A6WKF1_9PEZI|nr:Apc13p-domain-containing protein [Pseudovirgaria hyperparasitica]KAF2762638.1 Apc13p-domain-containing protein [Pseudovirgaria hyperparasitica]
MNCSTIYNLPSAYNPQSRDSSRTQLHLRSPHHADLFEAFTRAPLTPDDITIPPHLQPPNPEDEDDVVPDQHAAFGIQRATMKQREPTWRDLGLEELVKKGPEDILGEKGASAKGGSVGEQLRRKKASGSGLPR